jgi:hypothetical protein
MLIVVFLFCVDNKAIAALERLKSALKADLNAVIEQYNLRFQGW